MGNCERKRERNAVDLIVLFEVTSKWRVDLATLLSGTFKVAVLQVSCLVSNYGALGQHWVHKMSINERWFSTSCGAQLNQLQLDQVDGRGSEGRGLLENQPKTRHPSASKMEIVIFDLHLGFPFKVRIGGEDWEGNLVGLTFRTRSMLSGCFASACWSTGSWMVMS